MQRPINLKTYSRAIIAIVMMVTWSLVSVSAVMDLLLRLGRTQHRAVIVVTHDERMIEGFDRVYQMIDGRVTIY